MYCGSWRRTLRRNYSKNMQVAECLSGCGNAHDSPLNCTAGDIRPLLTMLAVLGQPAPLDSGTNSQHWCTRAVPKQQPTQGFAHERAKHSGPCSPCSHTSREVDSTCYLRSESPLHIPQVPTRKLKPRQSRGQLLTLVHISFIPPLLSLYLSNFGLCLFMLVCLTVCLFAYLSHVSKGYNLISVTCALRCRFFVDFAPSSRDLPRGRPGAQWNAATRCHTL